MQASSPSTSKRCCASAILIEKNIYVLAGIYDFIEIFLIRAGSLYLPHDLKSISFFYSSQLVPKHVVTVLSNIYTLFTPALLCKLSNVSGEMSSYIQNPVSSHL